MVFPKPLGNCVLPVIFLPHPENLHHYFNYHICVSVICSFVRLRVTNFFVNILHEITTDYICVTNSLKITPVTSTQILLVFNKNLQKQHKNMQELPLNEGELNNTDFCL